MISTSSAPQAAPTQTQQPALVGRGLVKVFGTPAAPVRALDGVDITVHRGTFTAIMGPSGSGKSTLLHCLAGLEPVTEGHIQIGDTMLTGLSDDEVTRLRREHVGFVFQSFNLLPTLTARQNIVLPLDLAGRRTDPDRLRVVAQSLRIDDRLDHLPGELSGGQQQRVAVARALITSPTVIVADEPTGALDSKTGQSLLSFLRLCVREAGQTVVMVTHDPLAAVWADRVVLLHDGKVSGEIARPTVDSVMNALRGQD